MSSPETQVVTGEILDRRQRSIPELRFVEEASRLLDTQFTIPGTRIRFGLDFILGLLPGVGSGLSLAFSALLVAIMARHGASGRLAARMIVNLLVDAVVGSVPLAGNVFDLFFRANQRNLRLMQEYYDQGRHKGSAWPIIAVALGAALLLMVVAAWLLYLLLKLIFNGM